VINQQVNLYQDRFRGKSQLFSAGQFFALLLILLIGSGGGSYLIQGNLDSAKQRSYSIRQNQEKISVELNSANAELATLLSDKRLDLEMADISREINARNKVLAFVSANQFGSGQGFSSYLLALSNLHVDNVWLDQILLAENYFKLRGSALSADLVPVYFDQFSDQPLFQGKRFNIFRLDRKEGTEWKVDFEIATKEILDE